MRLKVSVSGRNLTRVIILYVAILQAGHTLAYAMKRGDTIAGFKGGYSLVQGHYDGRVRNAGYYGLSAIAVFRTFLMGEAELTFARYPLVGSEGSYLRCSSVAAGPLVAYKVFPFLHPYAGVSAVASYLYLNAERQDIQEDTYKLGFAFKTGVFIPLAWGLITRVGVEYTQVPLSGEYFTCYNIFLGVSFNYHSYVRSENVFIETSEDSVEFVRKIDRLYTEGVEEFEGGRYDQAKIRFTRVISLEDNYKDTRSYLVRIEEAEKFYADAVTLISEKKYFQAIPLLERVSHMEKAREELKQLRQRLSHSGLIEQLEKQGIQLYEERNYSACIEIMRRIRLIDPDNEVASVYLPRAQKRNEVLQELK
jgi:tetratricopeptide (TPR) repeat protein